jgi:hypothetical protein
MDSFTRALSAANRLDSINHESRDAISLEFRLVACRQELAKQGREPPEKLRSVLDRLPTAQAGDYLQIARDLRDAHRLDFVALCSRGSLFSACRSIAMVDIISYTPYRYGCLLLIRVALL